MPKPPLRAIAAASIFFVFFLSLNNPPAARDSEGSTRSASSSALLHRYQYSVLNKSTPFQTITPSDRLNETLSNHGTKMEDTLRSDSQHGSASVTEEQITCLAQSCHKTVIERDVKVSVSGHGQDAPQASEYFPPSLSAIANTTNIRNPLQKDLWSRSWGSHPLPSRTEFTSSSRDGARWVTFFHDQAVAAVLLSPNGTIHDCIVQEVM